MSNFIVVCMIAWFMLAVAGVVWAIQNWDLVRESVDCLPENIRRLASWHKRRALRRWYRILNLIGGRRNAEQNDCGPR